ncbi:MAG: helix-turn-helix domain-containing protein, partial [Desulfuromonadales bacterium]
SQQAFGQSNNSNHFRDCVKKVFQELCNNQPGSISQVLNSKLEQHLVGFAMTHCNNNQVAAAKLLGISRNTLRRRLEEGGDAGQEAT